MNYDNIVKIGDWVEFIEHGGRINGSAINKGKIINIVGVDWGKPGDINALIQDDEENTSLYRLYTKNEYNKHDYGTYYKKINRNNTYELWL